jgi:hypothetical protein
MSWSPSAAAAAAAATTTHPCAPSKSRIDDVVYSNNLKKNNITKCKHCILDGIDLPPIKIYKALK